MRTDEHIIRVVVGDHDFLSLDSYTDREALIRALSQALSTPKPLLPRHITRERPVYQRCIPCVNIQTACHYCDAAEVADAVWELPTDPDFREARWYVVERLEDRPCAR